MQRRRHAMTLVELLVVLAVMGVLASLLAAVFPTFRDRSRAAKGAQAVQSWLNFARGRALMEQGPRGVRFIITGQVYPTGSGAQTLAVVHECQYIEQPEDYSFATGGFLLGPDPTTPGGTKSVQIIGADFSDGTIEAHLQGLRDKLEIMGSGQIHAIIGLRSSDPKNFPNKRDVLDLASDLPNPVTLTTQVYRIIRQPRVAGDEALKLPERVIINASAMTTVWSAIGSAYAGYLPTPVGTNPPANTNGYVDVLFSPTGTVMNAPGDRLILWICTEPSDSLPYNAYADNPTLLALYTNSGATESYAVVQGANPYATVR